MEQRRRQCKNKLINDIRSSNLFIERSTDTIERIRGSKMGEEYVRNQIKKLKEAILDKKELVKQMETQLSDISKGDLDEDINKKYKEEKAEIQLKTEYTKRIKEEKQAKLQADKKISKNYWSGMVKSFKNVNQKKRDELYCLKYFTRVCNELPDYMRNNLAGMPCNKGYIWRGVWFFGHLEATRQPLVMFERKGKIQVIHEFTDIGRDMREYKIFEKEGQNRKQLVFKEMQKKKQLNSGSLSEYM